MTFFGLLLILAILGFVAWIVQKSPVIAPEFKAMIVWGLLVIGGALLIYFVLDFTGIDTGNFNFRLK